MIEPKLDGATAEEVYEILMAVAGASDTQESRTEFVVAQRSGCSEYRFMGNLGFGGKFRHAPYRDQPLYVDCYPEDLTPEREEVIARTNEALRAVSGFGVLGEHHQDEEQTGK